MTSADIHEVQVLYKPGVQESIFTLLNLTADVVFVRADRLPSMAAAGLLNGSAVKVLDQVCCSHSALYSSNAAAR